MQVKTSLYLCLLLVLNAQVGLSDKEEDEKKDTGDPTHLLDDTVGQSMKGFGNFFKGIADGVKDKSEDGMEALKGFSDTAKEKSEDVAESMKGFAEGIGDRFSLAKEKLMETGENMKESFSDATSRAQKEFETAASEISKHAMGAGEAVINLFG